MVISFTQFYVLGPSKLYTSEPNKYKPLYSPIFLDHSSILASTVWKAEAVWRMNPSPYYLISRTNWSLEDFDDDLK
jgi:hypothetical protein